MTASTYPVHVRAQVEPKPPPAPASRPVRRRRGSDRLLLVATGTLGLLLSLTVSAVGSALLGMEVASRDPAGSVMNGDDHFSTETYALVSESFTIHSDAGTPMLPETLMGDTEVQVTGTTGVPIFVGVAATDDVADYLDRVEYAEVVDLRTSDTGDVEPVYDVTGDLAPAVPPEALDIWSAQASGTGTVSLVWPVDEGSWTLVVMNTDGSADVAAHVSVDGSPPWLGWASAALLIGATAGLLLSLVTLYAGLRDQDPPAGS
jgi:hypothetical protein